MNRLIIFALDNPRVASPIAVYAVTLAVIYGASLAYQSYFPEHFAKMGNELSIIALGVVVNAAFDRNSRFYNLHAPEVVVYIFAFLIFFAVSFGCYHYNRQNVFPGLRVPGWLRWGSVWLVGLGMGGWAVSIAWNVR